GSWTRDGSLSFRIVLPTRLRNTALHWSGPPRKRFRRSSLVVTTQIAYCLREISGVIMQKLFATALTFVLLLSLATTSLGQIQTATKREAAEAPPADAPIIDPSKVKFLMATCSQQYETEAGVYFRSVHGIVAPDIDLIQDLTVRRLLQMATEF